MLEAPKKFDVVFVIIINFSIISCMNTFRLKDKIWMTNDRKLTKQNLNKIKLKSYLNWQRKPKRIAICELIFCLFAWDICPGQWLFIHLVQALII